MHDAMLPALLAFIGLALIQVAVGIVYKLAQQGGGGAGPSSYSFNPSSALTISELIKLAMSSTLYMLAVVAAARPSAALAAAGVSQAERQALASSAAYAPLPLTDSSASSPGFHDTGETPSKAWSGKTDKSESELGTAADDADVLVVFRAPEEADVVTEGARRLVSLVLDRITTELSVQLFLHLSGLAFLYCVNNQLTFLLFRLVDSANVSLFKSGSTALTGLLLWSLFSRPIVGVQWASIALQTLGLVVVQYNASTASSAYSSGTYALLLLSTAITAVSSVWNEQLVKRYQCSLHLQNAALYLVGTALNVGAYLLSVHVPSFRTLLFSDSAASIGFLEGYTAAALLIIACNSVLGLVITAVYKYADAVIKTFATASATGALLLLNSSLFGVQANVHSYLGSAVVFIASYVYFKGQTAVPATTPSNSESRSAAQHNRQQGSDGGSDLAKQQEATAQRRTTVIALLGGAVLATLAWSLIAQPSASPAAVSAPLTSPLHLTHGVVSWPGGNVTLYGWGLMLQNHSMGSLVTVDGQPCNVTALQDGFIECSLAPAAAALNSSKGGESQNWTAPFSPQALYPAHSEERVPVSSVSVSIFDNSSGLASVSMAAVSLRHVVSHWARQGTVLIVLFSHLRAERVPFLRRHYGKLFSEVVFVTPDADPAYDVVCPQARLGYGSHICLQEVASIHRPGRSGYFLLQFDVVINWYNLELYDPNNFWWIRPGSAQDTGNWGWYGPKDKAVPWIFWGQETPKINALLQAIDSRAANDSSGALARYVRNYVSNFGPWLDTRIMGPADAFYLPARFVDDWAALACANCSFGDKPRLMMGEVSMDMLTGMIAPSVSADASSMSGVWAHDANFVHDQYWLRSDYVYFHKVALNDGQGQRLVETSVQRSMPSERDARAVGPPQ